ncbi:MAG: hypothetical protein M1834_001766 [Cirrosporium novae-zelandiae]|nr:MAG: hypothetical protein M1834_001766 [Cirrosporium novae-zelandiae]
MSNNGNNNNGDSSNSSHKRPRAPTINIDTSAVNPPAVIPPPVVCEPTNENALPQDDHQSQSQEIHPAPSFESRESRPTSPHNVSSPSAKSPTAKWVDPAQNFLSVPNARSRNNSVDSSESGGDHSPISYGGETFVPSTRGTDSRKHSVSFIDQIINDKNALKPDPGTQNDFEIEDNKFAYTPGHLNKLINPKSLSAFYAIGGLSALEKGLRTDRHTGLSVDETILEGTVSMEEAKSNERPPVSRFDTHGTTASSKQHREQSYYDRKRIFKDNRLPEKKSKSFWQLLWMAYNDKMIILLSIAAVVSLALGIYQTVNPSDPDEAHVEWVEGVAIIVAIFIVTFVGALNDYQKERQFIKLNKKKEDRNVKVIRSGQSRELSVHDILVGDIIHIEPGDMIPVDGIFIEGHNVKCDESSATGESDIIKKQPADVVFKAIESREDIRKLDPFILSGAKVNEGMGIFLVTSVGIHSSYGKTMMALQDDPESTPLQSKLNKLAEWIAKLGLLAGAVLFVALFIKFLATTVTKDNLSADKKGQRFLNIFITTVTIIVVAVPEGLPLAVTLALAFATTRMLKDNNLVRHLRACETMGNATTVCSDKTGTLTQNQMTVVAGTLGTSAEFDPRKIPLVAKVGNGSDIAPINKDAQDLLKEAIVLNTTAFEGTDEKGNAAFIGSKTESAMLTFAQNALGMGPIAEERANTTIIQPVPFDSANKYMGTVIKLSNGKYRAHVKGAPEILLPKCGRIIQDVTQGCNDRFITQDDLQDVVNTVESFASRSLRTIAVLYKDYEQWPPRGAPVQDDDPKSAVFDKILKEFIFLGIVGIQDPLRDGVADAVKTCQRAGVVVRMVTGDNLITAKAIAAECNIYTEGGIVMEGPRFRTLSKTEMKQIIPKLQVLARSSPEDKRILVKRLKEMGETVAVTGDGTNDAPALKTADIGFSMGIAGTEVAKEASAIILMDDNFASIVKALMWGRAVNDAVKKFLQFQVTVNITAVILTFVSAVASDSESSVLTAVQLLWVNLIMDTFAALALATDPPLESVLDRKPEPKSSPLISVNMWKMIVGQSILQLVVTFILYFAGQHWLGMHGDDDKAHSTLVFNTFVWLQIFNQYNCRRLDNHFNIFEGLQRNLWFIGIQFIIIGGQVLIVFVGGAAFSVTDLDGTQWGVSLGLGFLSLILGTLLRFVPDRWVTMVVPPSWFENKVIDDDGENAQFEWNPAIEGIREELSLLKKVRGGRLSSLKYKIQHPKEMLLPRSRSGSRSSRSRSTSIPRTPSNEFNDTSALSSPARTPESSSRLRGRSRSNSAFGAAAAMAGVVAGSIAGWSPIERGHGQENVSFHEAISLESGEAGIEEGRDEHAEHEQNDASKV